MFLFGKVIHFSHNPKEDTGFLGQECQYLQENGYTQLKIKDDNYYVELKTS